MKRSYLVSVALLVCCGLFMAGISACGGGTNHETVYLRFVNGYPGAKSMTLQGPQGSIFSDLKFGEAIEKPVEISRNRQPGRFQLLINGAPQPFNMNVEVFQMYPQETGTLFIQRRSGESSAESTLFRHFQMFTGNDTDRQCVLTLANRLALENGDNFPEDLSYTVQPQWRVRQEYPFEAYKESESDGQVSTTESEVLTRCGPVKVPSQYLRDDLYERLQDDKGWYYPVEVKKEGEGYMFVKGALKTTDTVEAFRPTVDYKACMREAITFLQPEQQGTEGGGGEQEEQATGTITCPEQPTDADGNIEPFVISEEKRVQIDQEAARSCLETTEYTGKPIEPGGNSVHWMYTSGLGEEGSCSTALRMRTPRIDLVFEKDGDPGYAGQEVTFDPGNHHLFILYGRPVSPLMKQWSGTGTVEPLDKHAYPGEPELKYLE